MIAKQQIINMALMRIGDVNTVNADIESNAYINDIYITGKEILLSKHYWNFAQKVVQLAMISDANELYSYKYKYDVPIDMGAFIQLDSRNNTVSDYLIVGNFLYCNYNPLELRYVSVLSGNDIFPAYFADALAFYIAKELCTVRGTANMLSLLEPLYAQSLKEAMSQDGRDVPSPVIKNNYYTLARLYG